MSICFYSIIKTSVNLHEEAYLEYKCFQKAACTFLAP